MDYQSYANPNMPYQTSEPEASELSFDLEEFINQYTMSSETWDNNTNSFESEINGVQPRHQFETTSQMWANENYQWMATTAESFDMPWGDLPLTAAQPGLPSAASSLSNVFVPFEEFEQLFYPSPTSLNYSPGPSSSGSLLIDGSSPSTSEINFDQQSPENQSPESSESLPPSPPSDSVLRCSFCAKTFDKKHLLNRHKIQHTKPVRCPIPDCNHRTAKTRDMQRHMVVHHSTEAPIAVPKFTCPVATCKHAGVGFKRRDHLVRHMKNLHSGVPP